MLVMNQSLRHCQLGLNDNTSQSIVIEFSSLQQHEALKMLAQNP